MKNQKDYLIGALVALLILTSFLLIKERGRDNIAQSLNCAQLYELKKQRYWRDEIGQSKSVFSEELDTCLALNIYSDPISKNYFAMVIDTTNDETLLYYSDKQKGFYFEEEKRIDCPQSYVFLESQRKGTEMKDYGCERYELMDKMFDEVEAFGFKVFQG